MAVIASVSTSQPGYRCDLDSFLQIGREWLGAGSEEFGLFERVVRGSKIKSRCFGIPPHEILSLNGMQHRADLFLPQAVRLGSEATKESLEQAKVSRDSVAALVFTSCSMPAIPAPDTAIIEACGLPHTIARIPMFQQGCGGGAVGLALAGRLAESMAAPVVVASTELCSLVYQPHDRSAENIVGSAIFADGAASAVVRPGTSGHRILYSGSYLIPESRALMGYDLEDDGIHLRLDRELPSCLARHAPLAIKTFLSRAGVMEGGIKWWLFHPGGARILSVFEEKLGLSPAQLRWSWDVLTGFGNMSSASILYVLGAFLHQRTYSPGDLALMVGIGPGLSFEFSLIECGDG